MEEIRNALRSAARSRRNALAPQSRLCWSTSIQAKLLERPQYLAATSIALYSAVDNEVDTRAILHHAFRDRKKVFFPKLRGDGSSTFIQVFSEADFIAGRYGIPEPEGEVRLNDANCESLVVIIPGLVFDCRGYRLGRGSGWYDRALRWLDNRADCVGLAYEFQIVNRLPEQAWDQRVHYVITESRVIDCGAQPQSEVSR
ncbi:MAG: 5-formyltetrahydrofolate cyclo-ligase [Chloroflexota bacterium]